MKAPSPNNISIKKKEESSKTKIKKKTSINMNKSEKNECNNNEESKMCEEMIKSNSIGSEKNSNKKTKVKKIKSSSKEFIKEECELDQEEMMEGEEDIKNEEDMKINDITKYFKEGQKVITPPNGDGTRAFYESLLDENPNSIIAIKYCIEHGVLSGTKHHETLNKYYMLKKNNAFRNNNFGGIKCEFVEMLEKIKNDKLLSMKN
ncbi:conserved Plasmodium protein, unknown function [Plasmodium vinckei vinckei]|uniref:Uncharacterized protein n=1 Tax=Plasmodium vinckei vinckei TaxID=54757 RepID=A0A081ICK4_PLAVN|nr:conserved Plasmodium protein, unknown function [Plasmodium vinckei vinckei]KEG01412.1 hypothetical protein YYE_03508 [Plasmodium vinckei vinckei]VEV55389.1 conserved Plasmodium protein, unknown function [Plasmodium vinckei vinckei]